MRPSLLRHFLCFSTVSCAAVLFILLPVSLGTPPCGQARAASKRCGCSSFAQHDQPVPSYGSARSTSSDPISRKARSPPEPPTETDSDGTEYYVIDDMMFRKRPALKVADDMPAEETEGGSRPHGKLNLKFWPGGIIFYIIDGKFSQAYREEIFKAMIAIEQNVGKEHLEFREALTASKQICRDSYMYIVRVQERKCLAEVGMQAARTRVWLNQDACTQGIIQHEILHALGRYHEQSRPDRDKFITIVPEVIIATQCANYDMMPYSVKNNPALLLGYDSFSIMHYGSCFFSCNGSYTMLRKVGSPIINPNRRSMTKLDVAKMRVMFPKDAKIAYRSNFCPDTPVTGKPRTDKTSKPNGGSTVQASGSFLLTVIVVMSAVLLTYGPL